MYVKCYIITIVDIMLNNMNMLLHK